jgi:hypothetical protein
MQSCGQLRIDPGTLEEVGVGEIEIVVPFTEWSVTEATLKQAVSLSSTLNARISLIAIHTVPYPLPFGCSGTVHSHLAEQLIALAGDCPLPVRPQVVLARDFEQGFQYALKAESTILIGSRKHLWKTAEERLAKMLAREGHKVVLVHVR